ncbi:MAG: phage terminase large subunit [Calothrix sp. SM1_7_51]|nr:phage terminase large subunit [Calothrix sp. SM1_7_51]
MGNILDGGLKAVSTGTGITGWGAGTIQANIDNKFVFNGAIVVDDPLKPQDKDSLAERPKSIEYFRSTLLSRRNNEQVPIIIIMQRLHEDDLTGWVLSKDCELPFYHLYLPAIDEDGNPLWGSKHKLRDLQLLEKTMGPTEFAGQYLQQPAPAEGGLFKDKYWKHYDTPPQFEYKIIVADTSEGEKQQSDPTVLQCWGKYLNRAYLIDQIKFKPESDTDILYNLADAFDEKHKPRFRVVEKANMGTGLAKYWNKKGKPTIAKHQSKSKVERANAVIPYFVNEQVYIPTSGEWVSDYLTEHRNFPNAKNDDQVDCTTLGVDTLLSGEGIMLYPEFALATNIKTQNLITNLPMFICFEAENQSAYIIAQLTKYGQLVVWTARLSMITVKSK